MGKLAEAISNINADADEPTDKDEQERELRVKYEKRMEVRSAKITEILCTYLCRPEGSQWRDDVQHHPAAEQDCGLRDVGLGTWDLLKGVQRGTPSGGLVQVRRLWLVQVHQGMR